MSPPRNTDKHQTRVLVVDDDPIVVDSLAAFLHHEGFAATTALSGAEALDLLDASNTADREADAPPPFGILLSDISMPKLTGLELLDIVTDRFPELVMILLTGYGAIEAAVDAIRRGAFDYLSKPIVDDELRLTIQRAERQHTLLAENVTLKRRLDERSGMGLLVGADPKMQRAFELIESVADSTATVLMTGESGTGKSMVARAIHSMSPRADHPFVEIHCGSIPETLLESELFGHAKGAFTGADADKKGRFQAADQGTIFIDEINSASPTMQLKLLRVLQERQLEPIGSNTTIDIDVRVILASNQPLEPLVASGEFRQDLYYRINVINIELPPLRDRAVDIPMLVDHFVKRFAAEHGRTVVGVADDALAAIERYPMPGNVRELSNLIERAVVLAKTPTITLDDVPPYVADPSSGHSLLHPHVRSGLAADDAVDAPDTPWTPTPLIEALKEPERRILIKALRANDWNRQATADQLHINRTTLYKKMKLFGIDRMAG